MLKKLVCASLGFIGISVGIFNKSKILIADEKPNNEANKNYINYIIREFNNWEKDFDELQIPNINKGKLNDNMFNNPKIRRLNNNPKYQDLLDTAKYLNMSNNEIYGFVVDYLRNYDKDFYSSLMLDYNKNKSIKELLCFNFYNIIIEEDYANKILNYNKNYPIKQTPSVYSPYYNLIMEKYSNLTASDVIENEILKRYLKKICSSFNFKLYNESANYEVIKNIIIGDMIYKIQLYNETNNNNNENDIIDTFLTNNCITNPNYNKQSSYVYLDENYPCIGHFIITQDKLKNIYKINDNLIKEKLNDDDYKFNIIFDFMQIKNEYKDFTKDNLIPLDQVSPYYINNLINASVLLEDLIQVNIIPVIKYNNQYYTLDLFEIEKMEINSLFK